MPRARQASAEKALEAINAYNERFMMVVGGLGRAWGPLVGAAALMLADEGLKDYPDYRFLGIGAALVLFVMLWPRGIVGAVESITQRLCNVRGAAVGNSKSQR